MSWGEAAPAALRPTAEIARARADAQTSAQSRASSTRDGIGARYVIAQSLLVRVAEGSLDARRGVGGRRNLAWEQQ